MIIQIVCFIGGIIFLIQGDIFNGLFNTLINPPFFILNLITLKSIKNNERNY